MGHPDFRVKKRIFATVWPDDSTGMVRLSSADRRRVVRAKPKIFRPVTGGWGRRGCTSVFPEAADEQSVAEAVEPAWRRIADPRRGSAS